MKRFKEKPFSTRTPTPTPCLPQFPTDDDDQIKPYLKKLGLWLTEGYISTINPPFNTSLSTLH